MPDIQILRDIVRIRHIQQTAAQQLAHARTVELQSAQAGREKAQAALDATEASWREALERPRLDLALLPAWTQGVRHDRGTLAEHDRTLDHSNRARTQAVNEWRASLAREDVAKTLWNDERRAAAKRAEERQLSAIEDRSPGAGQPE